MKESIAQTISKGALTEQSAKRSGRIKKRNYEESVIQITEKPFSGLSSYRYIVDLNDNPVSAEKFQSFDPNVRLTKGLYTISYVPLKSKYRNPKFPYLIGQDLVRIRVTVSGPKHWNMVCTRIPELAWINRNTDVGELFSIAKKHPGLTIRFGIKLPQYCKKIEDKEKCNFTILVADINNLKRINDTYGHDYGDILIQNGASMLRRIWGEQSIYRIGGDEFVILYPDAKKESVEKDIVSLNQIIEDFNIQNNSKFLRLQIAIGMASYNPETDQEYMDVFRRADSAMYEDKKLKKSKDR